MIIVYTPADGAEERYDAHTLRVSEVSIVQRTVDMKWSDIEAGLEKDDPEAMRGIAWVIKKRANPSLRYGDFDPMIGELTTRMDKREVTEYLENAFALAERDEDVTREDVARVCQRIVAVAADPEHAEQLLAEMTKDPKEETAAEEPAPAQEPEESASTSTPTSTASEATGSPSSPISSTSHPTTLTA